MSLISYVEPVSIGGMFTGLGALIVSIFFIYIVWRFFFPLIKYCETVYNRELKYDIVEEKMLDDFAKEKGIDLQQELVKRNVLAKRTSFRRKLEDEVFEKMFPKTKEGKK